MKYSYFEVQDWLENRQSEHGKCFDRNSISIFPKERTFDVVSNHIPRLQRLWGQLDSDNKSLFIQKFGQIADFSYVTIRFIDVSVSCNLSLFQFWAMGFGTNS